MTDRNPLVAQQAPDYQKMDYVFDTSANKFYDILPTGALNLSGLNSSNILSAANPARVGTDGTVEVSGDIVFQVPLPSKFMNSKRPDKQIIVRAIWFFMIGNHDKVSVFSDYKNAIKLEFQTTEMNHVESTETTQITHEETTYETVGTETLADKTNFDYDSGYIQKNNTDTCYIKYLPQDVGAHSKRNIVSQLTSTPDDTTITYSGKTWGNIIETLDITCSKNTDFDPAFCFPFGAYKRYDSSVGGNRWKFVCKRFLLVKDTSNNYTKTYNGVAHDYISQIIKNRNMNGGTDGDTSAIYSYYYYNGGNAFRLEKPNGAILEACWSDWVITNCEEILSDITSMDGTDALSDKNNNPKYETTLTNAYPVMTTSNFNQYMSAITCPVVSTLSNIAGSSYGITSMMSNTPYDHPTQAMVSTLPYFLLGFSNSEGTLYTIPVGKKYTEYCRCVVELTLCY